MRFIILIVALIASFFAGTQMAPGETIYQQWDKQYAAAEIDGLTPLVPTGSLQLIAGQEPPLRLSNEVTLPELSGQNGKHTGKTTKVNIFCLGDEEDQTKPHSDMEVIYALMEDGDGEGLIKFILTPEVQCIDLQSVGAPPVEVVVGKVIHSVRAPGECYNFYRMKPTAFKAEHIYSWAPARRSGDKCLYSNG